MPKLQYIKMLDFKIEGIESLQEDLDAFTPRIEKAIRGGLNAVSTDLTAALKRHIQGDVYDTFYPKDYQRRSEHSGMGIPLDSDDNIMSGVQGNSLYFSYYPSGRNTLYSADQEVEGDELIKILSSGKGYLWDVSRRNIPPRPFWENFVTEQIEGKQAETSFVKGMNEADDSKTDDKFNVIVDGNIVKDGNETQF